MSTSIRHHKKSRILATITKFRVIISIVLITTSGSFGFYILLSACKVEMRAKMLLSWQTGDDVRMQVPPVWLWIIVCCWLSVDCLLRIISQDKPFAFYLVIKNSKKQQKYCKKLFQTKIIYRKYPNLVRTQVEIISDSNYLVCILFER